MGVLIHIFNNGTVHVSADNIALSHINLIKMWCKADDNKPHIHIEFTKVSKGNDKLRMEIEEFKSVLMSHPFVEIVEKK